jgi:enoyl-CoA hydratase/carnithine racemase
VKAAKAAVNEAMKDASSRDLNSIDALVNACFDSDDYKEGRKAFKEKRKPKFVGS